MTASDPSPAFMPAALGSGLVLLVAIAGVCAAAGHAAAGLWVAAAGGLVLGAAATVLLHRQTGARQAAGAALQAAMARVGGIVDSAMDPIITVDEDQRIVQFNAAAEDVFRWPRRAALGQPLDMLLPQRFRGAHRQHIAQFGQTGVTNRRMGASSVLTGMRADGEEFPVEASISQHSEGGRKYYTVILRDVTLRERSAVLLANSEARLRNIVESAMDAIITVDEAQRVVLFNVAAEEVFGCPRAEAIGAPLAWFIPQRFRDAHTAHIRRFGQAGASSRRMGAQRVVTGLHRSGREFPIDASISQTSEGAQKFYTVILRDVTERVEAEQALRRSKEELQQLAVAAHSAREQEKTRIARELHDELGQMLTALRMDLAWLKGQLTAASPELLGKIGGMEQLLQSTVAATRRISADLRPLVLDDLGLVPAIEWLVHSFSQRTGIACELAIEDPELELGEPHASAVFRILQESLTNAAKHARASRVEVSVAREGSSLSLYVRDDGAGFDTSRPRKADSYGLLGLRERALLLGGDAVVSSVPGAGTSVEVHIPIAGQQP